MPALPMGSVTHMHPAEDAPPAALQPRLSRARAVAAARLTRAYVARRPAVRQARTRNSVAVLRKRLREAWQATSKTLMTWQAAALATLVIGTAAGVWSWPSVHVAEHEPVTASSASDIFQDGAQLPASGLYPAQKEDALQLKLSARISSSSTDHTGETK